MAMESKYIWMDGELVEFEKATIHILTPALHYGAAVFEGIRSYGTDKGPGGLPFVGPCRTPAAIGASVWFPRAAVDDRGGRRSG